MLYSRVMQPWPTVESVPGAEVLWPEKGPDFKYSAARGPKISK